MVKILFDISILEAGYSGIPQDSRRIFKMLQASGYLQVDAMIMGSERRINISRKSQFDHSLEGRFNRVKDLIQIYGLKRPVFGRIPYAARLSALIDFLLAFLNAFTRVPLSNPVSCEAVSYLLYRYFEADDLASKRSNYISKIRFANIARKTLSICTTLGRNIKIDTSEYDFFFTPIPCGLRVSPNTQLVVRYHDAIPITHPELVNSIESAVHLYVALKNCVEQNAIFVCNSYSSEQELRELFPGKNLRCVTIPCSIPRRLPDKEKISYSKVLGNMSSVHAKFGQANLTYISSFLEEPYLISIGNLEPKKNQERLIKSLCKLHDQGDTVNLILVGNKGWKSEGIIQQITAACNLKIILHLENVERGDLQVLISRARAFIFPSLIEGFGMGIAEAMALSRLVLCSDIPAHKYVTGGNAIFFDPIDDQSIMDAIRNADGLMNQKNHLKIVNAAYEFSNNYSANRLQPKWHDVFMRPNEIS